MNIEMSKIRRVEVIDQEGRSYVHYLSSDEKAELSVQDSGTTLKIFVKVEPQKSTT